MQCEPQKNIKLSKNSMLMLEQLLFEQQLQQNNPNLTHLNKQIDKYTFNQCYQLIKNLIQKGNRTIEQCFINSHHALDRMLKLKAKSQLIGGYQKYMRENLKYQNGKIHVNQLQNLGNNFKYKDLPYFYEAFDIVLHDQLVFKAIQALANQGKYSLALIIAVRHREMSKGSIEGFHIIGAAANCLENNEKDHQILDFIIHELIKNDFTKNDFKKLHEKCLRNQLWIIYNHQGYAHAQEVFRYNPVLMTMIGNQMSKDKKVSKNQFLSFCKRNPEIQPYLKVPNVVLQDIHVFKDVIENPLRTNRFQPSDVHKYLSLRELGVDEKNVFFINDDSKNLETCLNDLANSDVLGLDTESYVARSKFCSDLDLLATIQISNKQNSYIFDAKRIKNPNIGKILQNFFNDPKKVLVGHTLKEDLNATLEALGFKEKAMCQCIDVKLIFKQLYPGQRAGLQNICKVILGKPICKQYTLTDWGRRPLLKNQLHYAALDAVSVIHVNQKLQKNKKLKLI